MQFGQVTSYTANKLSGSQVTALSEAPSTQYSGTYIVSGTVDKNYCVSNGQVTSPLLKNASGGGTGGLSSTRELTA